MSLTIVNFIDEITKKYDHALGVNQRTLESELLKILAKYKDGDVLKFNADLANLEEDIIKALKKSGYLGSTNSLLKQMAELIPLNAERYLPIELRVNKRSPKISRTNIENYIINAKQIQFYNDLTVDFLKGAGMRMQYVKPVADMIRQNVLQGLTYEQATDVLLRKVSWEKTLSGDVKPAPLNLTRYAGQIAKDAINQYQGSINQGFKDRYNLTSFIYVGSEIETTRAVCNHIKNFATPTHESELIKTLDEYCPNGVPSGDLITIQNNDGKPHRVRKGGGMIDGTVLANFTIYRGGYNCRHECIWVMDK